MSMKKRLFSIFKLTVEKFPRIALSYRFIRDNRELYKIPMKTPMGFRLIGNKSMEKGNFEPIETELAKKLLDRCDIFINIGANIGYYCCHALQKQKYTVAIEPVHTNMRYLLKNVKANHWENQIEVFPIALSNKTGIVELFGGGTGASLLKGWANVSESYVNSVPVSTLDIILGPRFCGKKCFILIDIEGAEKLVLEGALSILNLNPKPIWMVEICIFAHQPHGLKMNPSLLSTFSIFWENGYDAWTVENNPRLITQKEIENIVEKQNCSYSSANFIFIQKGESPLA